MPVGGRFGNHNLAGEDDEDVSVEEGSGGVGNNQAGVGGPGSGG